MSFVKIWVHSVWGTKNREGVLTKEIRPVLFGHIKDNAQVKEIYIDIVNGHVDHVHCLFELNVEISLSKTLQLIKGEASHWANQRGLIKPKLNWADEYFAVSVSESMVDRVRAYILNQEEHHRELTWQQEHEMFLTKYKLRKD